MFALFFLLNNLAFKKHLAKCNIDYNGEKERSMAKPTRRAASSSKTLAEPQDTGGKRPTHGVKAGLREGEKRVTCILTDEQSVVLHDWARITGRTFREVTIAMADLYVKEVVGSYVEGGGKLKLGKDQKPPSGYEGYYEKEASDDPFAKYFQRHDES